jgi:myo-inositol-1(or 4)-monophosphatase
MSEQEQARVLTKASTFWVLDPLDGTTNFAHGLPFFSISLALVAEGRVCFGMVYDPSRDECFWAEIGEGAWLDGIPLRLGAEQPRQLCDCIAVVDYKRLDPQLACRLVRERRYRSQRNLGSVALEWCWLAAGRMQLYLHGGQRLWDYAAGRLICQEAGGVLQEPDVGVLSLASQRAVAATSAELLEEWALVSQV